MVIFYMLNQFLFCSISAQSCLTAGRREETRQFVPDDDCLGLSSTTHVIISSYVFECCGSITAWQTYFEPADDSRIYSISFQVWRPSPLDNECYSLVGENIFTIISIGLVSETPEPSDILTVQPGDVVGCVMSNESEYNSNSESTSSSKSGSTNNGLNEGEGSYRNMDSVCYSDNTDSNPIVIDCPLPALTRMCMPDAAAILSVSVCKFRLNKCFLVVVCIYIVVCSFLPMPIILHYVIIIFFLSTSFKNCHNYFHHYLT